MRIMTRVPLLFRARRPRSWAGGGSRSGGRWSTPIYTCVYTYTDVKIYNMCMCILCVCYREGRRGTWPGASASKRFLCAMPRPVSVTPSALTALGKM